MDASIRRLHSAARQLARGKHPSGVRYPAPFRDAVITLARTRVGHGQSLVGVAREVGVSFPTLAAWLERSRRPGLRPVVLAPTPAPAPAPRSPVVLITPHGFRVEGLDGAALVAVLRALS
jgi:transposase-like protein